MQRLSLDYSSDIASLSKSVLMEVFTILGSYSDDLVLVGGWAPYFYLNRFGDLGGGDFEHIGSIDIDIAVDPEQIDSERYATIVELIGERGYKPKAGRTGEKIHFSFIRTVMSPAFNEERDIQVDFLTYSSSPEENKKHRHRKVQSDLLARITPGFDLVFKHNFKYKLSGKLPDGAVNDIGIKIADLVSILATKGVILGNRYREKDAYDIFAVVNYSRGGAEGAAAYIRPHLKETLLRKAVTNLRGKFKSINSVGPRWVGTFIYPNEGDLKARERVMAEAFVVINEFLGNIDT